MFFFFIEKADLALPFLIQKTNNFNNDARNKNLLNAFFGGTSSSSAIQQMEDDIDDIRIDDDETNYNRVVQQTKSKLQTTNKLIAYGLDGNLKHELRYNEGNSVFKNELDLEQQQLFDEQKQQLFKLKPKLLNRYNRLTVEKKTIDSSSMNVEEKTMKYKIYLQNNDYFSSTEEYPSKKLKLVSHKSVSKHYIPLMESIMKDNLNNLIDLGLFNARRFRISWLHPLKYSCLSLLNEEETKETDQRKSAIFSLKSPNIMLQMKYLNMNSTFSTEIDTDVIRDNCIQYLQIQFNNSSHEVLDRNSRIPFFKANIGNKIIFDLHNATRDMRNKIGKMRFSFLNKREA